MRLDRPASLLVTLSLLFVTGCGVLDAGETPVTAAGGVESGATAQEKSDDTPAEKPAAERPEGLADYLPVPKGKLTSSKPEASAWEYVYAEVSSDSARSFAAWFEANGFTSKVHVDNNGLEQWYFQGEKHAVKLEHTQDQDELMYWVDIMSE